MLSKTRNIHFIKKLNNFKDLTNDCTFDNSKISIKFDKSVNNINNYKKKIDDNIGILNNSSFTNYKFGELWKRKISDKKTKNNFNYNNYLLNSKKVKGDKTYMAINLSSDILSKSFRSQNSTNNKKNKSFISNSSNNNLFSSLKQRMINNYTSIYKQHYYSKITRNKSVVNYNKKKDINDKYSLNKKNNKFNFKNNSKNNSKNKKINNKIINNTSYERFNITNLKTNNNIYNSNYFNQSLNGGIFNLTQINKININDDKNNNKKSNTKKKSFIEMAQQKINDKKSLNTKKNELIVMNNCITKSSSNTNDDVNSSNSIISRTNQISDCIEEIHYNFVKVVQSSKNIMKIQENIGGERIIDNNPNSTVIIIEERDIE